MWRSLWRPLTGLIHASIVNGWRSITRAHSGASNRMPVPAQSRHHGASGSLV
jgi:hypothetical protein